MSKVRGRGRPPVDSTQATLMIDTSVFNLISDIAKLQGVSKSKVINDFFVGAIPALEYTRKLLQDAQNISESSKLAFLASMQNKVDFLVSAVDSARQADIFDKR